jgi:bifunctional NMN adenylyltransferase/nudix hydrolase
MHEVAVCIGRWQLPHIGHQTLLRAALAAGRHLVIVLGSAYRSRNASNPFTWEERKAMLCSMFPAEDLGRVQFLPVRDYFNDSRWATAVRNGVANLHPGARDIALVGFKKDHTSYYLDAFPEWKAVRVEREHDTDATALRNVYFEGEDPVARMEVLRPYVPATVLAYLQAWAHLPLYAQRATEHRAVAAYRKRWTADAYLTADALVRYTCQGKRYMLLVRRGPSAIGAGQWALPGGFIDRNEQVYTAAVRELAEETGFKPLASTLRAALRERQNFDHPGRSPRARIVTTAFFFDMAGDQLPEVKGADDVDCAQWVREDELPALECELFEDHSAILDHFVGIFPADSAPQ